uniref:Uncharacterized protein n=1 Tax=Moniliophthora roreri TaxID=221103 RepID=A0A0W0GD06_MONRR
MPGDVILPMLDICLKPSPVVSESPSGFSRF